MAAEAAKPVGASSAPEVAGTASSAMAFDGDWPGLVRALSLGGAAKQLAQNSVFQSFEAGQFSLGVPKSKAFLCERNYTDKLKSALELHLGGKVALKVVVGEVTGQSLADIEQGEREARQSRAAQAVHADSFVRDLVEMFDATVIDNTIRPQE